MTAIESSSGNSQQGRIGDKGERTTVEAQHLVQQRQHFLLNRIGHHLSMRKQDTGTGCTPALQNARIILASPFKSAPRSATRCTPNSCSTTSSKSAADRVIPARSPWSAAACAASYGNSKPCYHPLRRGLVGLGLARGERVGIYLDKRPEFVTAAFGTSAAGGVFVPINPVLKADQVGHILRDCAVRVLVTTAERLAALGDVLGACHDLRQVVLVGSPAGRPTVQRHGASLGRTDERAARRRAPHASTPTWRRSCTPRAAPGGPRAWCCPTAT